MLQLRWLQFGAVAPIFRTHCDHCERRIWVFPHFPYMKEAMLLRNALIPYVYTSARRAYDTSISVVHPLYYKYPQVRNAYEYRDQYMFGSDIIAAPVSTPVDARTNTTQSAVWLPPGIWNEVTRAAVMTVRSGHVLSVFLTFANACCSGSQGEVTSGTKW